MAPKRRCEFCGLTDVKITKEHAWPNWIRSLFPAVPTTVVGTRKHPRTQQPIQFQPSHNDMGVKANDFCRDACNGGWMHDLEECVRPFMEPMIQSGARTELTRAQCDLLAVWAVKTAMVFEFTSEHQPFFTFEERNALRLTQCLPLERLAIGVRLARYTGRTFMSTFYASRVTFHTQVDDRVVPLSGNHAAISAGQLVFQVTVARLTDGLNGFFIPFQRKWLPFVTYVMAQQDQPVVWPRDVSLDDSTIDDFLQYVPGTEHQ
jgi:hypothetical protein